MEEHQNIRKGHPIPIKIIQAGNVVAYGNATTFSIQNLTDEESEEVIIEPIDEVNIPETEIRYVEEDESEELEHEYTIIEEEEIPIGETLPSTSASTSTSATTTAIQDNKSKAFYCTNCGNCYTAAGSLKLHVRACMKQKESEKKALEARKCNMCGRVYNSISYLKEHMLRHSGKAPRKCPKCYRKFVDYKKLDEHIKNHEKDEQSDGQGEEKKVIKEYVCSFCQKKFQVVFDSRYTKRRYACDECREKFTNEENLKQHKESLEEKREFRCERCGRKFVFEGFLQRHVPTCDGTIKRKRDRVF